MTVTIGRRELLVALGGAVTWPLAAWAQQQPKMPAIGFLNSGWPDLDAYLVRAFRQGLSETMSRARTWPSNIAGRTANTIECRRWRLSWFVIRWR
jgi:hypothetical protein